MNRLYTSVMVRGRIILYQQLIVVSCFAFARTTLEQGPMWAGLMLPPLLML